MTYFKNFKTRSGQNLGFDLFNSSPGKRWRSIKRSLQNTVDPQNSRQK